MRYTIKRGDTLWALARKHGVTVDELMKMNPHITDRNKIFAGRAINLPDAPAPAGVGTAPAESSPPGDSSSALPAVNQGTNALVRPPMFPEAMQNPVQPNPVQQDAQAAAQGMSPGMMDPMQLALMAGGAAVPAALTRAIPALAQRAPAALPQAGRVAMPMSKGAVAHPGAAPAMSNVRPITGSEGAAKMMMNNRPETLQETMQRYLAAVQQMQAPRMTLPPPDRAPKDWGF